MVCVQTIGPGLHGLMIDDMAGIDIFECFMSQTTAFFFLFDPKRWGQVFNYHILGANA
jgi:hypothetical protein